ncbi:hypothetical protein SAMN06265348_106306 [Pedobacter westerhofensis]|uniref:Uncharacterized protein n=1 Tax=Pedobacter westerhofensis TaxID=425512 RepID=A0A521DYI5_9SPHI|nr:hypothetical protein SAMN06265348_106306 [Pedobacter westerhofensis]
MHNQSAFFLVNSIPFGKTILLYCSGKSGAETNICRFEITNIYINALQTVKLYVRPVIFPNLVALLKN